MAMMLALSGFIFQKFRQMIANGFDNIKNTVYFVRRWQWISLL